MEKLLDLVRTVAAGALAGGWSGEEAVETAQCALEETYPDEVAALGEAQLSAVNEALEALVAGDEIPVAAAQVLAGLEF